MPDESFSEAVSRRGEKAMNKLYDANGDVILTDECACGRPKLFSRLFCCAGCPANPDREHEEHATGCNMRCATMGVSGFGVRATAFEGEVMGIVLGGGWR